MYINILIEIDSDSDAAGSPQSHPSWVPLYKSCPIIYELWMIETHEDLRRNRLNELKTYLLLAIVEAM
jgi:hypothetical protein